MLQYNRGKLYIKKRTVPQWLTLFVLIFPFCFALFIEFLNFPSLIKYLVDIAWVGAALFIFFQRGVVLKKGITPFYVFILVFLLYTLVIYLFNFQSIGYYLWGVRNNFRFYFCFLAIAVFLNQDDIATVFKLFDVLFWINAIIATIQFLGFGYQWDYLGGIFGTELGNNGYTLIFFAIIAIKSLLSFMNKTEKGLLCLSKCAACLILTALMELKMFFIVFILILILSIVFTKFSWRKGMLLIFSAFIIMFAGSILTILFGESSNILSFERLMELLTAESYASAEDLGRFTAIPIISRTILTELPEKLFGLGLGNCDTSTFAIFNTPFYQTHAYLHYNWFSSAFLFLETGYIGLGLNLTFFILCFIKARKHLKSNSNNPLFNQMALIMSVVCVVLTFYNSSLRTEAGYMAYFVLALPFISNKQIEIKEKQI